MKDITATGCYYILIFKMYFQGLFTTAISLCSAAAIVVAAPSKEADFDRDGDNLIVVNRNDGIAHGNFVQPFVNIEDNDFDDIFHRRGYRFGSPFRHDPYYEGGRRHGLGHRYWGRDLQTSQREQGKTQDIGDDVVPEQEATGPLAFGESQEQDQWHPYYNRYPYYRHNFPYYPYYSHYPHYRHWW